MTGQSGFTPQIQWKGTGTIDRHADIIGMVFQTMLIGDRDLTWRGALPAGTPLRAGKRQVEIADGRVAQADAMKLSDQPLDPLYELDRISRRSGLGRCVFEVADQDLLGMGLFDQPRQRNRYVADDVVIAARHHPFDLVV